MTEELIRLHGRDVEHGCPVPGLIGACPGYHALRAAGVPVEAVLFTAFELEGGGAVLCPPEFEAWQREAYDAVKVGLHPRDAMKPISFEIEVPDEVLV